MKVFYIEKGDIFSIEGVKNYAHGCNCAGAMGKGIALQFREKYPEMYKQYVALCKNGDFKPGGVFDYSENGTHIYNLGTQETWRTKAKLDYIRMSFRKMLELATASQVASIAMPAIGAGLGGLAWDSVKNNIEEIVREFSSDINLYVVEKYEKRVNRIYIKKKWDEENIIFYLEFENDYAIKQMEIHGNTIVRLSQEHPVEGEFFLYDQTLSDLEIEPHDYITEDEFYKIWRKDDHGHLTKY
jgi:Predicted phosphatase homologous to the C-terminal domain of histone macroH2A1